MPEKVEGSKKMKTKNIYNRLHKKIEDTFEAKLEYLTSRKDLKLISHIANKYYDEYVYKGIDGYIDVIKKYNGNFEYGWHAE